MLTEGGLRGSRSDSLWLQLALGRKPTKHELQTLEKGLAADRNFSFRYACSGKLSKVGVVPPPKDVPLPDYAAYTLVANVLLNLDEFIMRE